MVIQSRGRTLLPKATGKECHPSCFEGSGMPRSLWWLPVEPSAGGQSLKFNLLPRKEWEPSKLARQWILVAMALWGRWIDVAWDPRPVRPLPDLSTRGSKLWASTDLTSVLWRKLAVHGLSFSLHPKAVGTSGKEGTSHPSEICVCCFSRPLYKHLKQRTNLWGFK